MADVSHSRTVERGQVILVTGLLVASTLLVLVLLLNAVIYTENVATRGIEGDTNAADDYRTTTVSEFEALLAAENTVQKEDANASGEFANLTERIDDAASWVQNHTRDRWRDRGRLAEFEYTLEEGLLVWQDTDGNFSVTGNFSANVTRASRFSLNVSTADLHEFDQSLSELNETEVEAHAVGLNTSNDTWEIRLFNVSNGTAITGGGTTSICSQETFNASRLLVNLTKGSVNGVDCSDDLWGTNGAPQGVSDPFDVEVHNADNVSGQYDLVAEGTDLASGAPNNTSVVPDAELELTFESAGIRYEANVTAEGDVP